VRELLGNVVKHAGAARATVRVVDGPETVAVQVTDDGRGMDADAFEAALGRGNIGLASARERIAAVGGTIRVGPGLNGRGAGVTIQLPR
jgi:signal transduction histidine kinase